MIYIKGPVPGDIDEKLLVTDSMIEEKRSESLPFPTFYPEENDFSRLEGEEKDELHQIYNIISRDLYHPKLFQVILNRLFLCYIFIFR